MAEDSLASVPPLRLGFCEPYGVRSGGLAHVYLCRRTVDPDHVAVKRMRDEFARSPGTAAMFLDECRVWLRLGSHPNVVAAISVHAVDPEPPMVVLEFVERNLRDLVSRQPLGVDDALRIASGVCDAMTHLNRVSPGFVHLDLKPENILIDEAGHAKVTDFGLAKVSALAVGGAPGAGAGKTSLAGTPAYMSPEQWLLLPTTSTADIYSFGVVLFELLSGSSPFPESHTSDDYMYAHVYEEPRNRLVESKVPQDLEALVARCMMKDPLHRPQSFEEVRSEIDKIAGSLGLAYPHAFGQAVPADLQLQYAQGLLNIRAFAEARDVAAQVLEETDHPGGKLWATTIMARTHNDVGRPDLARPILDAGEDWTTEADVVTSGAYFTELARTCTDLMEAVALYRKAAELVPQASIGWWNLAVTQYKLGEPMAAIESARRAVQISPDLRYLTGLSEMLSWEDQHEEAINMALMSAYEHRHAPEAWSAVATAFVEAGQVDVNPQRLGEELLAISEAAFVVEPEVWIRMFDEAVERAGSPDDFGP